MATDNFEVFVQQTTLQRTKCHLLDARLRKADKELERARAKLNHNLDNPPPGLSLVGRWLARVSSTGMFYEYRATHDGEEYRIRLEGAPDGVFTIHLNLNSVGASAAKLMLTRTGNFAECCNFCEEAAAALFSGCEWFRMTRVRAEYEKPWSVSSRSDEK